MRRALIPVAAIAAMLALGGCTRAESGSVGEGLPAAPAPDFGSGDGGDGVVSEESAGGESGGPGDEGEEPAADREVITTGSMTITAEDPLAEVAEVVRLVEGAGGRIDARTEYAPRPAGEPDGRSEVDLSAPVVGDGGGATLTLRIPSAELSRVIEGLKELGTTEQLSLSETDVTAQSRDLDARIRALSASVDRLLALLATATDTSVLIEVESALSSRQAELESLQAQRRDLADQVAMSTLNLTLQSVDVAPVDTPDDFLDGLLAGWNSLLAVGAGALVALGAVLPWAIVLGLIALLALAVARRVGARRRAREEASASAPAPVEN